MVLAMRKLDIANDVAEATGLPLSESLRLVELVLTLIFGTLVRGEPVMVAGFGKFSVRQKQARRGRNPRTGESIPITPRRVVQFRASNLFKQAVASARPQRESTEPQPALQRGEPSHQPHP